MIFAKSDRDRLSSLVAATALAFSAGAASATEGYFQLGFGARQNALGGAGVADSQDAMALSLNPAGIVGLPEQIQIGFAAFMPNRGYEATGPGFVAPGLSSGENNSSMNLFVIPNFAYVKPIDLDSSWGVTLYGNGGMNTTYGAGLNTSCGTFGLPTGGVYCGGAAGVDLMQAFLSVGYARRFGPIEIGIAPTLVVQRFKAQGLAVFGLFGLSSDPSSLTDNGYDYSYGGGLRGGIQWTVTPGFRFAAAGQTQMYMTKFEKYSGLFANGGSFDIPATVTAGMAVDIVPTVTFMFDYQHIFYSTVDSISDSSTVPLPMGAAGGPGFGWHDVNVYKFGLEWRASEMWTFRAGYAYCDNPVQSSDVTLNILAPGIVTNHFTAGLSYVIGPKDTLELSGMYAPEATVSGIEVTPMGPNPYRTIELQMSQMQLIGSWTHRF
jgi:long-chain fatty acid transport protein